MGNFLCSFIALGPVRVQEQVGGFLTFPRCPASLPFFLFYKRLFIWLHWLLVAICGIFFFFKLQHMGSINRFLTRSQIWVPCIGSVVS